MEFQWKTGKIIPSPPSLSLSASSALLSAGEGELRAKISWSVKTSERKEI